MRVSPDGEGIYKAQAPPIMKTMPATAPHVPPTGLLLTGGGARAAYQVGVLEAIADIRKECGHGSDANPFPIIAGTSAGAINASALACGSDDFDGTVRRIAETWRGFHADQVYRADHFAMLRSGARWMTLLSLGWVLAKWRRIKPRSLLDNSPVLDLLARMVPLVENNEHNSPGADYFVQKYLDELLRQSPNIDTIVLGCTHYPFLAPAMERIAHGAGKTLRVIDTGEAVARQLQRKLAENGLIAPARAPLRSSEKRES